MLFLSNRIPYILYEMISENPAENSGFLRDPKLKFTLVELNESTKPATVPTLNRDPPLRPARTSGTIVVFSPNTGSATCQKG